MKRTFDCKRLLLPLLIVFTLISPLSAQVDWDAEFVFDPFPSPYLSDWESNGNIGSVAITNNTSLSIDAIIFFTLEESSRGEIASAQSNIFTFPPGSIENISTDDIIDYNSLDYNTDLEDLIIRTGRLPEGDYTACIELQLTDGTVLFTDICVSFSIVYPDPPYLIFPFDSDTLIDLFPLFQWTPVQVPVGFPIHYSLKIVETYDGQIPYQALQANPVQYENTYLTETSLLYPLDALELIKGKRYSWEVQVLDEVNTPPSSNNGKSEIWSFIYDPDTTTPPEMYSVSGRVWSAETKQGISGAELQYQPVEIHVNGTDTSWIPYGEIKTSISSYGMRSHVGRTVDGKFSFNDCEEGTYFHILVSAENYKNKTIQGTEYYLRDNITSLNIELELEPPGNKTISGKAVDFFTNKPLANQTIVYHQVRKVSNSFIEQNLKKLETITDDEGNFSFTKTADSSYFSLRTDETPTHISKLDIGNHMYQNGDIDSVLFLISPKAGGIEGYVVSTLGGDTTYVKDAKVVFAKVYTAQIKETTTSYFTMFGKRLGEQTKSETKSVTKYSGQKISVQTDENGYFICDNIQPEFNVTLDESSYRAGIVRRETKQELISFTDKKLTITVEHSQYDKYVAPDSIDYIMGVITDVGTHVLASKIGSVTGQIVSTEGPVENAVVRLFKQGEYLIDSLSPSSDSGAWGGAAEAGNSFASGASNASGTYLLGNIPINNPNQVSDEYIMEVTADGYYKQVTELRLTENGQLIRKNFTLADKPSIVSGQVQLFSGSSVSGARVVLSKKIDIKVEELNLDYKNVFITTHYTLTDGSGNYSFSDVPKGTYKITSVTPQNIKAVSDSFAVAGGRTIIIPLVTKSQKGSLAGVVKSSNGNPLSNVVIKSESLPSLFITTNIKGEFKLKKVPSGKMDLILTRFNHTDTTVEVDVPVDTSEFDDLLSKEGDADKVEIIMELLTGTYKIKVVDMASNSSLANMEVSLGKESKTTNSSGMVTFKDIGVGRQELKVSPPESDTYDKDYVPFSSKVTVNVGLNSLKTIELVPGARMSGKVVDVSGGKGIGSVAVHIDGNKDIKAKTAKDGTFTLKNLPAGKPITLVAQKPGYKIARLSKNWSITAGDHIKNVTVKMEESPVDSIFGFAIVLDSMTKASGNNNYLTGSLIQIKNSFGLSFKDKEVELRFIKLLVDENYKPIKDSFNLEVKELDVTVFGFEGNMQHKNGLKVEWIDSLSVGRIVGDITIMDATSLIFPETKLGNLKIPKKKTPTFGRMVLIGLYKNSGLQLPTQNYRQHLKG